MTYSDIASIREYLHFCSMRCRPTVVNANARISFLNYNFALIHHSWHPRSYLQCYAITIYKDNERSDR